MKYFILNLVPIFFRDKWPLKGFYWQKEQLERAEKRAKELLEKMKWEHPTPIAATETRIQGE